MSNFAFPKNYRLRKRCEFEQLKKNGKRIQNHLFLVNYAQKYIGDASRLGITVTKKTGSAVVRNRIKRLVRETFRLNRHKLTQSFDINVIAKKRIRNHTNQEIIDALLDIYDKLVAVPPENDRYQTL